VSAYNSGSLGTLLTATDKAAFKRAMQLMEREQGRIEQLRTMLDEPREWEDVAKFASYVCQMKSLKLMPWQWPPCWGNSWR
jgi:hypothetical protein